MQVYCLARRLAGRMTAQHDIDIANVVLYWHFVALTSVITVAVIAGFPGGKMKATEPLPEEKESLWLLAVSPAIWAGHFVLCYLTAAIWCANGAQTTLLGGVRICHRALRRLL